MDWNALRTFLAIARNGTLAGAARELNVNHSTVFRRLNAFEEQIGSRLFDRLNEGYRLTQAGEDVLHRAEDISNAFDNLERHIAGQDFKPKGVVRITAPDNIAYSYLPDYLTLFKQSYPDIHVEILVSNQDFNLSRREADIAIRATPSPPEYLVGRKIAEIGWGIYGSEPYLKERKTLDSVDDLSDFALIGAVGEMGLLPAFRWLEKHHSESITARCSDLVSMSHLAKAGYGLAFLPDDVCLEGLRRVSGFEHTKSSHLWLLTHPDARQVERIKLLVGHLTLCFKEDKRLKPTES